MNFFKRISIILFMFLMLCVGALFLLIALNTFSAEQYAGLLGLISGDVRYKLGVGGIGAILAIIGIIVPYNFEKKFKKNRLVAFQNPDGEVTVSLSAIEDYVYKIAKGISGIKDIRSNVDINKKGINIKTDVSIISGANIPEVTEKIQMEVKNKVKSMLGVEEYVSIKMHVKKILKSARDGEEDSGSTQIPFRESR